MTSAAPEQQTACMSCSRRSWLLAALSPGLDYHWHDRPRLFGLLSLSDEDLIQALAGRRRAELTARHAQFPAGADGPPAGGQAVCRHDRRYPRALAGPAGPALLNVAHGGDRLAELAAGPVVAIVGSRRATDYGIEMAKSLACGLAAARVTVTSGLGDGIAVAAHAGALEADGSAVVVMAGGLDVACPARRRSLYERIARCGCAVSELPPGCAARRWGHTASERVIAGLAAVTVVVEADDDPAELAVAQLARALGRVVAAMPGRVTSPASRGAHVLLMAGAPLVRGPADVLELLLGAGAPGAGSRGQPACSQLEPRLMSIYEQVGAGHDTPDKLAGLGQGHAEVLLALSELELAGLLARGDGGRYVPRAAIAPDTSGQGVGRPCARQVAEPISCLPRGTVLKEEGRRLDHSGRDGNPTVISELGGG